MFDLIRNGVALVDLQNTGDVDISSGQIDLSWNAIVELFSSHEYRSSKNGRCFMPVRLKPKSDWVLSDSDTPSLRNDANIEAITMIVLDLDTPGAREKAESIYADFEYIVYSTHSYTKDTPYKFRIIIRLEDAIPAAEWPSHFKTLVAPIDADKACGNLCMLYFFPSHDPAAEIRPYFYHHKGRTMTYADLTQLKSRIAGFLDPKQLSSINAKPYVAKVKKHFSGSEISAADTANQVIDYTYEGMCKRFSSHLNFLATENNRHTFALRVIKKEVEERRSKIDLFQLIQFIYRASTEFGTKPITDPSSNTRDELPEMVSSAIKKFCPDMLSGQNSGFVDVRSHVKNIVMNVDRMAITGEWAFESAPRANAKMEEARKIVDSAIGAALDTFESFKHRNRLKIREFISTGDYLRFGSSVIKNEFESANGKVNINQLGEFIFYCYARYIDKVIGKSGDDKNDLLTTYCNGLLGIINDMVINLNGADDKTSKFISTAFKMARHSSTQDSWRFIESPEASFSAQPN